MIVIIKEFQTMPKALDFLYASDYLAICHVNCEILVLISSSFSNIGENCYRPQDVPTHDQRLKRLRGF